MTKEAMSIINLLDSANNVANRNYKQTSGVTLVQLIELFRGSKSKTVIKNYKTDKLHGYGLGSKYKKHEIERITHKMICEKILIERGVENNGGYMSEYINLGEKASPIQNGRDKFYVEFPLNVSTEKVPSKKQKKAEKKRNSNKISRSRPAKKSKSSEKCQSVEEVECGGLKFAEEISIGSISDDSLIDSSNISTNKENSKSVLPHHHTKNLVELIKKLVQMWATEEQLLGNNVHCKSVELESQIASSKFILVISFSTPLIPFSLSFPL